MGTNVQDYRDLQVWQRGIDLVTKIYVLTSQFPPHELYGLGSQMRRAAVSVPSNIAEGWTRQATNDYIRFLRIAKGSLAELATQVAIAHNLHYIEPATVGEIDEITTELGKMISGIVHNLLVRNTVATPSYSDHHPSS